MVWLLLVLSIILGLEMQQADYVNAFYQAPFDQMIYIELPNGFESPNKMIFLQRSVYGLSQSLFNFYNHLRQGLESR